MIDEAIYAATCYVSCADIHGTGYLIRADRVLTARHCILKAISSNAPIELTFTSAPEDNEVRHVTGTVTAESSELDICIISISPITKRVPLPVSDVPPREGSQWKTFGFPESKGLLGHRLCGEVARVLPTPQAKVDLDLSVDPMVALQSYHGLSGSAVVVRGRCIGVLRVRFDGSVAAISIRELSGLLKDNEIPIDNGGHRASERPLLANRQLFQQTFEASLVGGGGKYFFLEGAHGIGKSTFCQYFEPTDGRLLHFGTYCVLELTGDSNTLVRSQSQTLYDWIITTLFARLRGQSPRHVHKTYPEMVEDVSEALQVFDRHCQEKKCTGVLIVDGLNEVQSADSSLLRYFVGLLPRQLPSHIAVVFTSTSFANVRSALADRLSSTNVHSLPLLDENACIAYCGNNLTEPHASDYEFIRRVCTKANGHPLYLNYLIRHSNTFSDVSLDNFPVLDGPIEDYYNQVWQALSDEKDATHLLSIMARLREDLPFEMFINLLNDREQAVFVATTARVSHLLLQRDHTTIYHASFRAFIEDKTRHVEQLIQSRLSAFCRNSGTPYGIRNRVFHSIKGSAEDHAVAMKLCTQEWVDDCVLHSATPDVLLSDVDTVVEAALRAGMSVEVIRLLLLHQRVTFRYDRLFAQSAGLVAEALVALDRPREALTHVVRHGTLIMSNRDALRIAYAFIRHDNREEALEVLDLVTRRCIRFHSGGSSELSQFVEVTLTHMQAVLLSRLADGESHMRDVEIILQHAHKAIGSNITESSFRKELVETIVAYPLSYFLGFCDTYVTTEQLSKVLKFKKKDRFHTVAFLVLHYVQMVEEYGLSKQRAPIGAMLSDMRALLRSRVKLRDKLVSSYIDASIRLGATVDSVEAVLRRRQFAQPQETSLRSSNGVDASISDVHLNGVAWRATGFLDATAQYPSIPRQDPRAWLSTLEQAFAFVFYCDGRARRAIANGDQTLLLEVKDVFRREFFAAVQFTLSDRVTWERSYALPETSMPFLYEQAVELIYDCFPELIEALLDFIQTRCQHQLGLYTEGFRSCLRRVVSYLIRHELQNSVKIKLLSLLNALRNHIVIGVENRHELVPELLQMVLMYSKVGAMETAAEVYRDVLRFSMGPSWYKENQFSLMTSAVAELPPGPGLYKRLPAIAGNLRRASGEMTFQRFVRDQKSSLIGAMAGRGLLRTACEYFKAESCGSTAQLVSEYARDKIDVPRPRRGYRYPGGALEEQDAIHEIVYHGECIDWRLRWVLLEVFLFGDVRYVEMYAEAFSNLFAEASKQLSARTSLTRRVHAIVIEELDEDERPEFISAFYDGLPSDLRHHFESLHSDYPSLPRRHGIVPHPPVAGSSKSETSELPSDDKPDLYAPGIFGRTSSIAKAERELEEARAQLLLGNSEAAKQRLVSVLSTTQAGGWSIWEGPAECTVQAEAILKEIATSASDLTTRYAGLVVGERHVPTWMIADHLITQVSSLLPENERHTILDHVLIHIRKMIGDASNEEEAFRFLDDPTPSDPSSDVFKFVVWLVDHPSWLRRERAAEMLCWLVDNDYSYIDLAVALAFQMTVGFGADVLCGVLDIRSRELPLEVWERVQRRLAVENTILQLKHVGRIGTIYRIAKRASDLGSRSAATALAQIQALLRTGEIDLNATEGVPLPQWSNRITRMWTRLEELELTTLELRDDVKNQLSAVCHPFGVSEVRELDAALSTSFRTSASTSLNRWEAKVHFALNTALFPYVAERDLDSVSALLSIYSPTAPCRSRTSETPPPRVRWPSSPPDYSMLTGDGKMYYLHYHRRQLDSQGKTVDLLALAVMISSSRRSRGFFLPEFRATFTSSQAPSDRTDALPHETCCHVIPEHIFLGSFTPAFLLPQFETVLSCNSKDLHRIGWKRGRSKMTENRGAPDDEGCLLAVQKAAVVCPDDKKLAWIIVVDGEVQCMVDAENNELY